MINSTNSKARVLKLLLYNNVVGYLIGFNDGRNILSFAPEYCDNPQRPTLSLITSAKFPGCIKFMAKDLVTRQKLHPILSNLLPEGVMREMITSIIKVHTDDEFSILGYLGRDLPGALIVEPIDHELPQQITSKYKNIDLINFDDIYDKDKFSLAGVQLKFSMREKDDRYYVSSGNELGDWIIKPPSIRHIDVPLNEYSCMKLASKVGIDIPEVKLVGVDQCDFPHIELPKENFAFAIKRFDRSNNDRIHMEDFAQVLLKYPYQKYDSASYEQLGKIIFEFSADGLSDVQQFARRLLVNILLANGDAHLKNWSLLYLNQIEPRISPAYDILMTSVYINNETQFALNLAKTKNWYDVSYAHFAEWSKKVGVPWQAIKPHLEETIAKARELWLQELNNLPMNETHKKQLILHWHNLHQDFRIG